MSRMIHDDHDAPGYADDSHRLEDDAPCQGPEDEGPEEWEDCHDCGNGGWYYAYSDIGRNVKVACHCPAGALWLEHGGGL